LKPGGVWIEVSGMLKMITEKADHLPIDSRANGKIGVRPAISVVV